MDFEVGEWGEVVGNICLAGLCLVVFGCLKISLQLWQCIYVQTCGHDGKEEEELASFGAGKLHGRSKSCVSCTQCEKNGSKSSTSG